MKYTECKDYDRAKYRKKIEGSNKSDDADLEELLYRLLIQKSDLLYFICRRGSWNHKKQRGKKNISFDPRRILKDREIDCKKLAKNPLNKVSKNINLISVRSRKNWNWRLNLLILSDYNSFLLMAKNIKRENIVV